MVEGEGIDVGHGCGRWMWLVKGAMAGAWVWGHLVMRYTIKIRNVKKRHV